MNGGTHHEQCNRRSVFLFEEIRERVSRDRSRVRSAGRAGLYAPSRMRALCNRKGRQILSDAQSFQPDRVPHPEAGLRADADRHQPFRFAGVPRKAARRNQRAGQIHPAEYRTLRRHDHVHLAGSPALRGGARIGARRQSNHITPDQHRSRYDGDPEPCDSHEPRGKRRRKVQRAGGYAAHLWRWPREGYIR